MATLQPPPGPEAPSAIKVGLIGVGTMGRPMALNILDAGFGLSVWARRPESLVSVVEGGAKIRSTPAELARFSDVLVVMLTDLPDLRALLDGEDGILAGVIQPLVLVVCSTVSPQGVRDLARDVAEVTGGLCHVVDAPVSGGETGAIEGSLAIMIGGALEDVGRATPVLAACGTAVHLGPLGAGQVAKACNQVIVAATTVGLGEAVVLAERSGVDVGAMLDLLQGGLAGSRILELKRDKFVQKDHRPTGAAKFLIKDLGFVLDQASATGATLPLSSLLREIFTDLTQRGYGDEDTSVIQAYIDELS